MFKNKKLRILLVIMLIVFGITFYFGIFANPKFNVYDFFMNLSSEILGLIIALVLVDIYVSEKKKEADKQKMSKNS